MEKGFNGGRVEMRHRFRSETALSSLAPLIAAALAACSNGGGFSHARFTGRVIDGPVIGGDPPHARLTGRVIDGPVKGATVYIDVNGNDAIDSGDVLVGITDDGGWYSGTVPPEHAGKPLLADLSDAVDVGDPDNPDDDAPLSGVWRTSAGGRVISPYTEVIERGDISSKDLARMLGLPEDTDFSTYDLLADEADPATSARVVGFAGPEVTKLISLDDRALGGSDAFDLELAIEAAFNESMKYVSVAVHELHPLNKPIHVFDVTAGTIHSLAAGVDDNDLFTVDPATHRLLWKELVDYENPADIDANNIYRVKVDHTATDGAVSRTVIDITVQNIVHEVDGTSKETIAASGVDAYAFSPSDIPVEHQPSERAQYLLTGQAWAMPAEGPLVLTWSLDTGDLLSSARFGWLINALETTAEYDHLRFVLERAFGHFEEHINVKFIEVEGTAGDVRGDIAIAFAPLLDRAGYRDGGATAFFPLDPITVKDDEREAELFQRQILRFYPEDNEYAFDLTKIVTTLVFDEELRDLDEASGIGWGTIIHEIGHVLGLKHPWEGGTEHWPKSHGLYRSTRTVMDGGFSYHPEQDYVALLQLGAEDIEALRFLYGSPGGDWRDSPEAFFTSSPVIRENLTNDDGVIPSQIVAVDENIPAETMVLRVQPAAIPTSVTGTVFFLEANLFDNDLFAIDADDGEVRFRLPPDFENPLDGRDDPKFGYNNHYKIRASYVQTYIDESGTEVSRMNSVEYLILVMDTPEEYTEPTGDASQKSPEADNPVTLMEGVARVFRVPDPAVRDLGEGATYTLMSVERNGMSVMPIWLRLDSSGLVFIADTTDDADIGRYSVTAVATHVTSDTTAHEAIFDIAITNVNEAPSLAVAPTVFRLNPGETYTLNQSDLRAVDEDVAHGPRQLTYTLESAPLGGSMEVSGDSGSTWAALPDGGTFSQHQVNRGWVRFVAGLEYASAALSFTVADPEGAVSEFGTLSFDVVPNTAPTLDPIPSVTITNVADSDKGDRQGNFSYQASDGDPSDRLTYTVEGPVPGSSTAVPDATTDPRFSHRVEGVFGTLHYNESDGRWKYLADNGAIDALGDGEDHADTFTVTASDGEAVSNARELVVNIVGRSLHVADGGARASVTIHGVKFEVTNPAPASNSHVNEWTFTFSSARSQSPTGVTHYADFNQNTNYGHFFIYLPNTTNNPDAPDPTPNYLENLWNNQFRFNDGDQEFSKNTISKATIIEAVSAPGGSWDDLDWYHPSGLNPYGVNIFSSGMDAVDKDVTEDTDSDASGYLMVEGVLGDVSFSGGTPTDPNLNTQYEIQGNYGTLVLDEDGDWAYKLDNERPAVKALGSTDTVIDSIEYTVTDAGRPPGEREFTRTLEITVNGSNDAPVLTVASSPIVATSGITLKLTRNELHAMDEDARDGPEQLVYRTVEWPTSGQLYRIDPDGRPDPGGRRIESPFPVIRPFIYPGEPFTQADIDAGRIGYRGYDYIGTEWIVSLRVSDSEGLTSEILTIEFEFV